MKRRLILAAGLAAAGAGIAYLGTRRDPAATAPAKTATPTEVFDPGRIITIGFIYVGSRDDQGYNQSHAAAARQLERLPWIRVVHEENVAEDETVVRVMKRMIETDGAEFVFPTSFGYFDPYLIDFAPNYPDVRFLHTGGLALPGHPRNISSCYGYIDEAMFLAGIAAGFSSRSRRLGFVGAMPIPVVVRNINSFTLGARSIDPGIQVHTRFTGTWHDPVQEKKLAVELFRTGADVMACHVDSPPTIIRTCEESGIFCIGYHVDQSALAPTRYLTGAEWNWGPLYHDYLVRHLRGRAWPTMRRGGIADGIVKISAPGPGLSLEAVHRIDEVVRLFTAGGFDIYTGPIRSNQGEVMVPAGTRRKQDDPWLETMDWMVEGVSTE